MFLLCDIDLLKDINHNTEVTRNTRIIQELQDKNDQLQSSASIIRVNIPGEVSRCWPKIIKRSLTSTSCKT
jgi:predicted DNA-binding ribbon-helix-helix protein